MIDVKTRDLLRKLYVLYNRPGSTGEKSAAKEAINRINKRLPEQDRLDIDDNISDDNLLDELYKGEPNNDIFSTKEQMYKRWAKMSEEARNKTPNKIQSGLYVYVYNNSGSKYYGPCSSLEHAKQLKSQLKDNNKIIVRYDKQTGIWTVQKTKVRHTFDKKATFSLS